MISLSHRLSRCLVMLTILASPLSAQLMSRDTARLADRSVTATKLTPVRGVSPAATTLISGDEIRARGITFVLDALKEVPGIMVVPNGSYGAITSVYLRGGESDYIKVLLDGVVLNQPGGSIYLADLTTENLDRIEVVRGPVSVLYGADAVSGVIQLFTKQGSKSQGGGATIWRGTFGNAQYDLNVRGKEGRFGIALGGSDFKSKGTYEFNNGYRNRGYSGQLDYLGKGGQRFAVTGSFGDAKANYPTDYTGIAVDINQYNRSKTLALGLSAGGPVKGNTLFAFQGFASRQKSDYVDRADSPGDTTGFGYDADRASITARRGGDLRFDVVHPATGSILSFGAGYEKEKEEQNSRTLSNFGTGSFEEVGEFIADRTTKSLQGQAYLTPGPFVTLQIGGRLDDNSAYGNFVTWRGGAAWDRAATRLWISAGSAFKAPTFSELFAESAFEVGNPDLDAERSTSVEIGAQYKAPGSRFVFGLSAYKQRFRDLIQYVNALPGETNYLNLGGAESRGLEATLVYHPNPGFRLQGTWSWLDTEVTDSGSASSVTFTQGERLLRRPPSSGNVSATWKSGDLELAGVVHFIGERDDVDYRPYPAVRTTLHGYRTVDLSVGRSLGGGKKAGDTRWKLMLRGENLFDTEYEQVVAFPGRGRTLFIGLRSEY